MPGSEETSGLADIVKQGCRQKVFVDVASPQQGFVDLQGVALILRRLSSEQAPGLGRKNPGSTAHPPWRDRPARCQRSHELVHAITDSADEPHVGSGLLVHQQGSEHEVHQRIHDEAEDAQPR